MKGFGFWCLPDGTPIEQVQESRRLLIKSLTRSFEAALTAAVRSGDGYLQALLQEYRSREFPAKLTRPIYVHAKRVNTREYAKNVFHLAHASREAVMAACGVWAPASDVVDTGLEQSELDLVCDVAGSSQLRTGMIL